ncbi:hypothetical protein Pla144_14970 [Bythopirellula polymerisocia]|uniref:Uncharacterized protein n=1 Tax=Bythopirellula polymerisocia TaxID=2528003 RepID=A0A5C6CUG0_9BACT|nr:hypothetical protein Pla144_14970 [Bythopirellula polymerisocia]
MGSYLPSRAKLVDKLKLQNKVILQSDPAHPWARQVPNQKRNDGPSPRS